MGLAVLVLELGVQEHGHEIVGGILGPPLDVPVNSEPSAMRSGLDSIGLPGSVRRFLVGAVAHGDLAGSWGC
ncbi:MAG: hypothetical protein R2695_19910 [Acidimicrobiales bacterium]